MTIKHDQSGMSPEKLELLAYLLAEEGITPLDEKIPVRDQAAEPPLSFAQQRLWFLDQLESERAVYNIPAVVRFKGAITKDLLEQSLNRVIARHEILRTNFLAQDGQAYQSIAKQLTITIPEIDLSNLLPKEREAQVHELVKEEIQRPFNLDYGPLLRATVYRLTADEIVFALVLHHIISDGWSMSILIKELGQIASSIVQHKSDTLPPLNIQYADFAVWQRQWLQGDTYTQQINYWKEKLASAPPVLTLPTDYPRPLVQRYEGKKQAFQLNRNTVAGLKSLVQGEQKTLFMVLLTAFKILLSRYSRQTDILVGSPIANRTRPEIEDLIGFFVNTLVLRTDLSGNPRFDEALERVNQTALEAYAHQDIPFEKLVQELHIERNLQHSPLFQVMFSFQQEAAKDSRLSPMLEMQPFPVETTISKFDLTLYLIETSQGIQGQLEYNIDLFESQTISRMIEQIQHMLDTIIVDPTLRIEHISLMSEQQLQALITTHNPKTIARLPQETIHERFEAQAIRTPNAVALRYQDQSITYQTLNEQANQVARYLQTLGIKSETLVGLYVERSIHMVIGLLGILKAGAAYVPLDPDYPQDRLTFMLADAHVQVVLTEKERASQIINPSITTVCLDSDWSTISLQPKNNIQVAVNGLNVAYVIYTSGSTGKPKGTLIPHTNVIRLFDQTAVWFNFNESDIWTMFHSYAFDFSVWEIWGALLYGGTVIIVPFWISRSPEDFYQLVLDQQVTVLNQTPSAFRHFMHIDEEKRADNLALRYVIFGGEALELQSLRSWIERHGDTHPTLVNMYGITETTVHVSYRPLVKEDIQPGVGSCIGQPIPDLQMYILDLHQQPVPYGVEGELYVGGNGLARGYHQQPQLTAQRFIPHPWSTDPGARLYRTGDLARYTRNGDIEHLGRCDDQVKIRGFRIELGEIEVALQQHPAIQTSAVIMDADRSRLIAYVIARSTPPATSDLRAFLEQILPIYMIPATFVWMEALPLTTNGKLDRAALPAPEETRIADTTTFVAPTTAVEEILVEIWSQVLGIATIGINDNFFDLGGDSILSIQIVARANQAGLHLTPRHIFEHQTIAQLAVAADYQAPIHAEQGFVEGVVPLTPIQHWFFDQHQDCLHHFNQAVLLEIKTDLDLQILAQALNTVLDHHDALRLRFRATSDGWLQEYVYPIEAVPLHYQDINTSDAPDVQAFLEEHATFYQQQFNLDHAPLFQAVVFNLGVAGTRLLLIAHHLVIDAVSWRIILSDLIQAYLQLQQHEKVTLPAKTTSFKQWSEQLQLYAATMQESEKLWWYEQAQKKALPLPVDMHNQTVLEARQVKTEITVTSVLDSALTSTLLREVPSVYHTHIHEVLLTAIAGVIQEWVGSASVSIDVEGHGREQVVDHIDLTRTVGWFTAIFPVWIEQLDLRQPGRSLQTVKERLRQVPNYGVGYGVLRYLDQSSDMYTVLTAAPAAQISFNYLGQFDQDFTQLELFAPAKETHGAVHSQDTRRPYLLSISASIVQGQLHFKWSFSSQIYYRSTIEQLADRVTEALKAIIQHCQSPEAGGFTPSDFTLTSLNQQQLNKILKKKRSRK